MMQKASVIVRVLLALLQLTKSRLVNANHRPQPSTRVVGGTEVKDSDEFPFFVNLGGCSGSLVHGDIVLTAAHVS
jgi:hypothetical protein